MKRKILSIIFTLPILMALLLWPKIILAIGAPTLSNPSNGSTVSSTTLNWQAPLGTLASSNPYRVQVADNAGFSSPKKDYYTANTNYSPTLDNGIWYWRVKAKDSSGIWSEWCSVWSFTLGPTTDPSPSPPASSEGSPHPTPSPTPDSTNLPKGNANSPSMQISTPPSSIDYDQTFTLDINLTNFAPNIQFYLKGAFIKPNSSNYFGQTKVNGSWIKNNQSYSSQFSLTTDGSGNWNGSLQVMPDASDSGFTGADSYNFKVARYSASGSGPTWSNQFDINIVGSPPAETTDESDPSPTSSPSSSSQASSPSPFAKTNPGKAITLSIKESTHSSIPLPNLSSNSANIAGISTESVTRSKPITLSKTNFFTIAGLITLIFALVPLIYTYITNKSKYAVPNQISRGN